MSNTELPLVDCVIVQTLERVVQSVSRDSGLYAEYVVGRETIWSSPMAPKALATYLDKRRRTEDSVIAVRVYKLVPTDV